MQLCRYFGAQVAWVCSTQNLEVVKSLGAERVIDHTKEDFAKRNELFVLIFHSVGEISRSTNQKCLAPNGKYVLVFASGQSGVTVRDVFSLNTVRDGNYKTPA